MRRQRNVSQIKEEKKAPEKELSKMETRNLLGCNLLGYKIAR